MNEFEVGIICEWWKERDCRDIVAMLHGAAMFARDEEMYHDLCMLQNVFRIKMEIKNDAKKTMRTQKI